MAGTHSTGDPPPIIPAETLAPLAQCCPDLADWPRKWCYKDSDIPPGVRLVTTVLAPFLMHLLDKKLAQKTLRVHRDNLWLLGGEVIRQRYESTKDMRRPVEDLLAHMIDEDGGPLICPRISESAQDSLDATCRKLYRFLSQHDSPAT